MAALQAVWVVGEAAPREGEGVTRAAVMVVLVGLVVPAGREGRRTESSRHYTLHKATSASRRGTSQ